MGGEFDFSNVSDETDDDKKETKVVKELAKKAPRLVRDHETDDQSKPVKKEKERQFNLGMLPISVHKSIKSTAKKSGMNRRTFILNALKDAGVEIPEEYLRDRREIED